MGGERRLHVEPTVEWRQQRLRWASAAVEAVNGSVPQLGRNGFICGTLLLADLLRDLANEPGTNEAAVRSVEIFDCNLTDLQLKAIDKAWNEYFESADGKSTLRLLHESVKTPIETAERLVLSAQGHELLPSMSSRTFGATFI